MRALATAARVLLVVLALWLAWRLAAGVRWGELSGLLGGASRVGIGAAAVCLAARFAGNHVRWALALRRLEPRSSPPTRFFILLAAVLVNHLTPAARVLGGLVRARYLAVREEHGFATLYGVVLADQVSHQVVQAVLTWLALIALAWRLGLVAAAVLLAVPLAALAVGLIARRRGRRADRGAGWVGRALRGLVERRVEGEGRLRAGGREALGQFRAILADRGLQWRMAALGVLFFVLNVLAQWLIFLSLGVRVEPVTVALAIAVGVGAGVLSGTPGGLGTTEAALIASYAALGVERQAAVAATLLYRGLHYGLVLALGLPALLWFELGGGRPEAGARGDGGAPG